MTTPVRIFSDQEIETLRGYVEANFHDDDVARMDIVLRDHGACVGLVVETRDGARHAVAILCQPPDDDEGDEEVVTNALDEAVWRIQAWLTERRKRRP